MDIIKKIQIIITETTLTGDVEKNITKGHVPIINMGYKKKKKKKRKNKLTGRDIIIYEYEEEEEDNEV